MHYSQHLLDKKRNDLINGKHNYLISEKRV